MLNYQDVISEDVSYFDLICYFLEGLCEMIPLKTDPEYNNKIDNLRDIFQKIKWSEDRMQIL